MDVILGTLSVAKVPGTISFEILPFPNTPHLRDLASTSDVSSNALEDIAALPLVALIIEQASMLSKKHRGDQST